MKALVLVADGCEEIETVTAVDILRRARIDVTMAAVQDSVEVVCSRGVRLTADVLLDQVVSSGDQFAAVLLPGGAKGAETFSHSATVQTLLREFEAADKFVCAMCASTMALHVAQVGKGKRATSYPSFKERLAAFYKYEEDAVVVDEKMITSRGPATAMAWALSVVEALAGEDARKEISKHLLFQQL